MNKYLNFVLCKLVVTKDLNILITWMNTPNYKQTYLK